MIIKNTSYRHHNFIMECEATPNSSTRQTQSAPMSQAAIKTTPIQQQRLYTPSQQQQKDSPDKEYDFAAEISRQCLVPDPVGLLDCVENKVTLPYMSSWVECTNSLGQNVKTSADIINYRCKSVWEGKGVIPEVFYIKDCVIAKTGLPAKRVSAEVLGAYKECEATPTTSTKTQPRPVGQSQATMTQPIQQQQLNTVMQSNAGNYGQRLQPVNPSQIPPRQRPFSQQYFVLYPSPPLPKQQFSAVTQQQILDQPIAQQQLANIPFTTQQQIPVASYMPQAQPAFQQGIKTAPVQSQQVTPHSPQSQMVPLMPQSPFISVPNGAYYYGFQIKH